MERVADWQLENPSPHPQADWTQGAGDAGIMALAGISGSARYREAMRAMGEAQHWKPGPRLYDSDDQCVGQTYAELFQTYGENAMIGPLREEFERILSHPSAVKTLEFDQKPADPRELWSWCDSLFMGPPAWMRLYAATGDRRFMDFAVRNWWRTTDYLYDPAEHLYFRDSTYFNRREANERKVFWSRGNGWVMAGLVRTLQSLPANHPDRPRFEKLFAEMAVKVLSCQQPDGLWRSSLLDPDSYPLKEASGSGFYVYALAWGANQHLLDMATCGTAAIRGWDALVGCVGADGKLTHVQPIGADPKRFPEDSTEVYGVGAFLLAGSEVYRMAVVSEAGGHTVEVRVTNPSDVARLGATVEVNRPSGGFPVDDPVALDAVSSRILASQTYAEGAGPSWDTLVFQVDLAPHESRVFRLVDRAALAALPPAIVKTYAREVHERFNDAAWESDRTAHRIYHADLIKGEGTLSSGIDVWSKRTRGLVVDEWNRNGDYHNDHGDGMDDYHVSRSRGCGGLGIWDGGRLYVSSNFTGYRLITTGPVRSEFELAYDAWDAGGRKVSEVRRISIDAGSYFSKATSVFSSAGGGPLTVGVGIALRAGPGNVLSKDPSSRWMSYWQAPDRDRGDIACAVITPGGASGFLTESGTVKTLTQAQLLTPDSEGLPPMANELALVKAEFGRPFVYYFGSGWSKSGDFPDEPSWRAEVARASQAVAEPLVLEIIRE
jgi:rhamnogalacturonyl hydrolase YesR